MNIIAADVGGTHTRLACASAQDPQTVLFEKTYPSGAYGRFEPLLEQFIHESGATTGSHDTLALALPGLVSDDSAHLTNLPWVIEKQSLEKAFGINRVVFMNDFEASVYGTSRLQDDDCILLNPGTPDTDAGRMNTVRVAVGAGTGLGVAWAQLEDRDLRTHDTEGGHIDFAPLDETQVRLLQFLQQRHDHVSYERLLSGSGLVSLYEFCTGKAATAEAGAGISAEWVSRHADSDETAGQALSLFVQVYGAYIGNIALLFKPRNGIYITGGIAAGIPEKMQSGRFIEAYLNKGRMRELVAQIPVRLVTNERVGLLGALAEAAKTQRELP